MRRNSVLKIVVVTLGVLVLLGATLGWLFGENLRGYDRYQDYCEKEGGLKIFKELERDVGWSASDIHRAKAAAALNHVLFVRYRDEQGLEEFDLRYIGGPPGLSSSYKIEKADKSVRPLYALRSVSELVPNELRLRRWGYEVVEIESHQIVARYYRFTYSKFDPNRTLLSAPSGDSCFAEVDRWKDALDKAFKAE